MKRVIGGLVALIVVSLVDVSHASTLGKRIVSGELGIVQLGDDFDEVESFLDDIYVYGVGLQLPLGDYLSLLANVSRTSINGSISEVGMRASLDSDLTAFVGGARLQFLPGQMINPYVGVAYSYTLVEVEVRAMDERFSDDDWESALILSAGVEISFTDQLSVLIGVARTDGQSPDLFSDELGADLGDADIEDTRNSINASVNFWLSDNFLLGGTFWQDLEDDTRIIGGRLGFRF